MSVDMLRELTPLMRAVAPMASDSNGGIVKKENECGDCEFENKQGSWTIECAR